MRLSTTVFAIAMVARLSGASSGDEFVVHEWGTFTSVAGGDGGPVQWATLTGGDDLPHFVHRLDGPVSKWSALGYVRMETPVVYFYADHPLTASLHVRFPQGLITEWFPQATSVTPTNPSPASVKNGEAIWDALAITPGIADRLPQEKGPSHYYAARETDSASVKSGSERDKLIFYRGVANFAVPLRSRIVDGKVQLLNRGPAPLPFAIVFENRDGRAGFRTIGRLSDSVTVDMPELDGSVEDLRTQLAAALTGLGLFPKEAKAMIETWHDSWFEPGLRVFYGVPRSMTDAVLPVSISPEPNHVERVFVGRVEMLAPWMAKEIRSAMAANDQTGLQKYGRFLGPFLEQIQKR